jgi:divalent metal cation (Fe/Co/Zn/Cd) transporter
MVYCVKCGTNNPDDAQVCTNCGAQLYTTTEGRHYRRMEDECFGIPRGGTIAGLAIGIIILFAGLIWFLQAAGVEWAKTEEVWPIAVIIFGILLVVGAVYGWRRRY